ncbi:hypothetical protein BKA70DRAFT_1221003 [Coprinopsis sp. MPI-PUGE-AT-0042]|nr:hypothetical protein BKA70DRAFT_1221003 [Coprinopsis sp. MPI-PUGE-AT-0042]
MYQEKNPQSARRQPEKNPQDGDQDATQMDTTHRPAPGQPSGARSSGSRVIPARIPDEPQSSVALGYDRGSIQNREEVDGSGRHDRDVPTIGPSPDEARNVKRSSGLVALEIVEGQRDSHRIGRYRWAWLKTLVQMFQRVRRDRRTRADGELGQRPLAPPHPRQGMSPPTLVVPTASGASQQPSTSGSGNTPTSSQVPSYLPPPLHIVHQGGTTQAGVEGHINTPSTVFGGLNQAHVNGGTFYAGQTINIYYVNHGSPPT